MRFSSLLTLALVAFVSSLAVNAQQISPPMPHFWLNGQMSMTMVEGAPAIMELAVMTPKELMKDPDESMPMPGMMDHWMRDFIPMHMKHMHMVIVKKDLSHIAHIHPSYDSGSGYFTAAYNLRTAHPDNGSTLNVAPSYGEYAIFAEAKSKALGFLTFRADMNVTNANGDIPADWRSALVLDEVDADGNISKCMNGRGQVSKSTCELMVTLRREVVRGCGGNLIRFYVDVRRKDANGNYVSDEKLKPWMMMGAHALLARDSGQMRKSDYFHLHAEMPHEEAPTTMEVSLFNRGQITKANYKMWVQFKSAGHIFTAPFIFEYTPTTIDDSLCPESESQ